MFSERGIKAMATRLPIRVSPLPTVSSFPPGLSPGELSLASSSSAPTVLPARVFVPLLLVAETAAFALGAASGKIPLFLLTAIRALLTF
jgi:hypothetical protein